MVRLTGGLHAHMWGGEVDVYDETYGEEKLSFF